MPRGTGWLPDLPDVRDYTPQTPIVREINRGTTTPLAAPLKAFPPRIDRRADCSPIRDQGDIGSCTAFAACGMYEFYQRRAFGDHVTLAPLFVYKATRKLMNMSGDTGAWMRSAMGALTLFGAPPEKYAPYDPARFDVEPTAFQYSFARNFQALRYFRLDTDVDGDQLVTRIRSYLFAGRAVMFGFTVYSSLWSAAGGRIPFPSRRDAVDGGHAVVAVGYDDGLAIKGPTADHPATTGAFLIRNSWGASWGEDGYGWLPYEYARRWLADDWWAITQAEWVETRRFDP